MLYTIVYKLFDLVKVGRKPPLMDMVLYNRAKKVEIKLEFLRLIVTNAYSFN